MSIIQNPGKQGVTFGVKMFPMNNPSCLSAGHTLLRFIAAGLFLFLMASCSSTKKLKQSRTEKETTVDRSTTATATATTIKTTEKIDTTVIIEADTTGINYFVPWHGEQDTTESIQEAETPTAKIIVSIKPVFKEGKRISSAISIQAIKKKDSVTLKIDKTTTTNIQAQTQTKNDIIKSKEVKEKSNQVDKKRFSFSGVLLSLGILIILIIAWYLYNRYKKTLSP